jgi:hypothetical protein
MLWDTEECYLKYVQVSDFLKGILGISQLDIDLDRKVLLPYQTQIIDYLNTRLIKLGTDDIKAKLNEVFDIFSWGADLICSEAAIELGRQIGIGTENELYDQDRFVFSWTDLMSTLRLRLKLQYAYLFASEDSGLDDNCCCCHTAGETTADYESWQSGVNPNDEVYDRTNYDRVNSSWKVSKDRYCECYRHSSQSSNGTNGNE